MRGRLVFEKGMRQKASEREAGNTTSIAQPLLFNWPKRHRVLDIIVKNADHTHLPNVGDSVRGEDVVQVQLDDLVLLLQLEDVGGRTTRHEEQGAVLRLMLGGPVVLGEVVLPIIQEQLLEGCGSRIVLVVRHVLRLQRPQRPVLVQLLPLVRRLLHLLRLLLALHLLHVHILFFSLQPIVLVLQVDLLVVDLLKALIPQVLRVDDALDAVHPLQLQLVAVVHELKGDDDHDDYETAGKLHDAVGHVVVHRAGHLHS